MGEYYDGGAYSSIALNDNNKIVEVHSHQKTHNDNLYYLVNTKDNEGLDDLLGTYFDTGKSPCVTTNNEGFVVEAHHQGGHRGLEVWYTPGIIDGDRITWFEQEMLAEGKFPSISMSNEKKFEVDGYLTNVVVSACEDTVTLVKCQVGYISSDDKIVWNDCNIELSGRSTPSISINDSGDIVMFYSERNITSAEYTYYKTGKIELNPEGLSSKIEIKWGGEQKYKKGLLPCVSVNNNQTVVMIHGNSSYNKLYYSVGVIDGGEICWGEVQEYDKGKYPSVTLSNEGDVIATHHSLKSSPKLFYRTGKVNVNSKMIEWNV